MQLRYFNSEKFGKSSFSISGQKKMFQTDIGRLTFKKNPLQNKLLQHLAEKAFANIGLLKWTNSKNFFFFKEHCLIKKCYIIKNALSCQLLIKK
jgi:hypothetical protein